MPASPYIQVILRNDDIETFRSYDDNQHILAKGELAAVWKVKTTPDGDTIYQADGVTPESDKLLFHVIGDGFSRFSALDQLWPVSKGVFNSVVSGREGSGRNLDDITQVNATHRFETLAEALDNFYHPYARPFFNGFNPSGYATQEVGTTFPLNFAFSWSSAFSQNVKPNSVLLQLGFNNANSTLASGLGASGSFTPSGLVPLRGTSIGQQATFTILGANTRNEPMSPVTRSVLWAGKRALFMHPNSEWLIAGMSAKQGEASGSYVASDATVAALINAALDGANGILGNGSYGLQTLDGGNAGARAYLAYPKVYRTSARFIDPSFNVDQAPVLSRELSVPRNGVVVTYVLLGLDLRIVQQLQSNVQ
jgi:hypothetical protein